ncbi:PPE family protein, SVP subgroup [Mycobacterium sp. SMC-2]|uniref:PPE family protein, SVP subgroup n=1 Tax=Mycobacterium sp. SMC-2 TaxID=2857058 RepID=UPI0021B357BE
MQAHPTPRLVWPFHPSSGGGAPSAAVGEAGALGPLSVPPAWTTIESAPPSPPDADAAPQGRTFQRTLMATIIGRDAGCSFSAMSVRSGP